MPRLFALVGLVLLLVVPVARAQSDAASRVGVVRPAAVLVPETLDERVRAWWQDSARQQHTASHVVFRAADYVASPGLAIVPPLVWGLAQLADHQGTARVARRTTESVLVGSLLTTSLKVAFGRARPQVSGRSSDWQFGRGWRGSAYQAFPSGHTTVAFAAAGAWILDADATGSRRTPWIAAGALTFATTAALARLHLDKHWLTDVIAGAVMGSASAMLVQATHRRFDAPR
jgi:membrane-associated phospholipid phosphatase